MNRKQALDWLGAVAGCFPGIDASGARGMIAAFDACGPCEWEAGVSGAGLERVSLRCRGLGGYAAWAAAAGKTATAPKTGFTRAPVASPWFEARWNLGAGELEWSALYGRASSGAVEDAGLLLRPRQAPVKLARRAGRFDARAFPDAAVARALAEFSALAPVEGKIVEREVRGLERRWALRLRARLPWPEFQRCDISASFTKDSSQFALLTPAHAVRELAFEGESLWAYFEG